MDLALIEVMPLADVGEDCADQFLSLALVRAELASFWTLTDLAMSTGGPARCVRVEQTGGRVAFITPLSHNFCETCNCVRPTCSEALHACLGRPLYDSPIVEALGNSSAPITCGSITTIT
jgi:cyclic pyranopterin phosphate synthase